MQYDTCSATSYVQHGERTGLTNRLCKDYYFCKQWSVTYQIIEVLGKFQQWVRKPTVCQLSLPCVSAKPVLSVI